MRRDRGSSIPCTSRPPSSGSPTRVASASRWPGSRARRISSSRSARYDVQRKDGETGEFKTVESVGGDKSEYTDGSVGARQKDRYRLIEHADTDRDDPVIAHDKTELSDDARDLKAEDIADAVETPQDKYITIDGGSAPDVTKEGDAAKGSIDVKVWIWHPTTNQFQDKNYRSQLEGKTIGAPNESVTINKKAEKLDFSTGATIEEVGKAPHQRKGLPAPVDTIYAKIRWPWMAPNADAETIWEKEDPPEIDLQKHPNVKPGK